jgi:hypothetical protein
MTDVLRPAQATRPGALLALLLLTAAPGCQRGDGLSDYERAQKPTQDAAAALRDMGGSVTMVRYPQGDGWAVALPGAQITDGMFGHLKALRRVAELDLSRSTVTDDQMALLNEQDVGTLLVKLDLSHTAVTDAGLEKLTNLYVLFELNLVGTKVTAAGVEAFKKQRLGNPKVLVKRTAVRLQ